LKVVFLRIMHRNIPLHSECVKLLWDPDEHKANISCKSDKPTSGSQSQRCTGVWICDQRAHVLPPAQKTDFNSLMILPQVHLRNICITKQSAEYLYPTLQLGFDHILSTVVPTTIWPVNCTLKGAWLQILPIPCAITTPKVVSLVLHCTFRWAAVTWKWQDLPAIW
jgi:hypothetical protein